MMETYEHLRHKAQLLHRWNPKENTAKNDVGFIPTFGKKRKEWQRKQQQNDDADEEKNDQNGATSDEIPMKSSLNGIKERWGK